MKPKKPKRTPAISDFDWACKPNVQLLARLGSALVHAEEYFSPDGREVDKKEFLARMDDEVVQRWMKAMGPLLPLKRVLR
jgi:hypothetical protein